MRTLLILFTIFTCLFFTSCEYDNFEEPNAILSGKVVYNGVPVGVRTNGTQLELWQTGYELNTKIPVYVAHDGSYSVALFNGQYKLVRLAGAPWEAQSNDTIVIDVKGNTVKDIDVIPYFIIENESFRKGESDKIIATFTINKIVKDAEMTEVNLYVGENILTDQNRHEFVSKVDVSTVTPGDVVTISATLPENLAKEDFLFVRLGVRSNKSNEFYYTQVQKLQ